MWLHNLRLLTSSFEMLLFMYSSTSWPTPSVVKLSSMSGTESSSGGLGLSSSSSSGKGKFIIHLSSKVYASQLMPILFIILNVVYTFLDGIASIWCNMNRRGLCGYSIRLFYWLTRLRFILAGWFRRCWVRIGFCFHVGDWFSYCLYFVAFIFDGCISWLGMFWCFRWSLFLILTQWCFTIRR